MGTTHYWMRASVQSSARCNFDPTANRLQPETSIWDASQRWLGFFFFCPIVHLWHVSRPRITVVSVDFHASMSTCWHGTVEERDAVGRKRGEGTEISRAAMTLTLLEKNRRFHVAKPSPSVIVFSVLVYMETNVQSVNSKTNDSCAVQQSVSVRKCCKCSYSCEKSSVSLWGKSSPLPFHWKLHDH